VTMADRNPPRERIELVIAACFGAAGLAGVGLLGVYLLGGQTQVEAILLAIALGGIGIGIILWSQRLLPNDLEVEARHPDRGGDGADASAELLRDEFAITRRTFLLRALLGAFAGLAAALAIPALSLGPGPGKSLFQTPWRRGMRLVGEDGNPILASALPVDGVLTAFPEGHVGSADGQTLLIRVAPGLLRLPPDRLSVAPEGYVAYSKVCTHAGCPVGLYRSSEHRLICPCHQSTFDVLDGATPVFGPAVRPLPQLPIQLQADGTFVALSDYGEPIGPSFWNIHDGA
jgi:ubiquinol-cytochrome c reductase iron-sulfur subunit